MSRKIKTVKRFGEKEQKRIFEAKKSFRKMQEEISPFIKHRKFSEYSTAGEWRETSSLYL